MTLIPCYHGRGSEVAGQILQVYNSLSDVERSFPSTEVSVHPLLLQIQITAKMKYTSATVALLASLTGLASSTIQGFDVSHYQSSVDWSAAYSGGLRFVMIKATEGTTYIDPSFSDHYEGATNAGFIRGGYHFARFASSGGAAQANYFLKHGGGWSGDGITLPGMLDLEDDCSSLSASSVVSWIQDFVNTYHGATGRYPILYFSPSWWKSCTGNSQAFHTTCPLDLASWNSEVGPIPGGWPYQTFWQYADSNKYGGDSDSFNGDSAGLSKMATG